jgi:hypothetical protein
LQYREYFESVRLIKLILLRYGCCNDPLGKTLYIMHNDALFYWKEDVQKAIESIEAVAFQT